jgi:hypothetical protein
MKFRFAPKGKVVFTRLHELPMAVNDNRGNNIAAFGA